MTSSLPAPLVDRYWFEVEWVLRHAHGMTPTQADETIRRYRANMVTAQVGDSVYHDDVNRTAAVLAGVSAGRPTP